MPSVRMEPELRDDREQLLEEGETLSPFVEDAVRSTANQRQAQVGFVARGMSPLLPRGAQMHTAVSTGPRNGLAGHFSRRLEARVFLGLSVNWLADALSFACE